MPQGSETSYEAVFNDNNQEFVIAGKLRPRNEAELQPLVEAITAALENVRGTFYLNVKRLGRLNNTAFRTIAGLLTAACGRRGDLRIEVVTSSVVGWSTRKFQQLAQTLPQVTVNEYDKDFYPGQSFLEDGGFIPILRNQTRMTWRHERKLLPAHGLKPGMKMADICCGIGDFAVLLRKEFGPSRLIALDHSRSSLDYARKVAADFGIADIGQVWDLRTGPNLCVLGLNKGSNFSAGTQVSSGSKVSKGANFSHVLNHAIFYDNRRANLGARSNGG
jgi:hypothetical protein